MDGAAQDKSNRDTAHPLPRRRALGAVGAVLGGLVGVLGLGPHVEARRERRVTAAKKKKKKAMITPGPAGPAGPPGFPGPPGPPGLVGPAGSLTFVRRESTTVPLPTSLGTTILVAQCQPGETVVGGGYSFSDARVVATASGADSALTAWFVTAVRVDAGGTGDPLVVATAVCTK